MSATTLRVNLEAAGLNVREYSGWVTRGGPWEFAFPIGILQHHTAPPVPFPVDNLAGVSDGGRIKCNMNIKSDGTVWLIAYEAPNYSSGKGSSIVQEQVIAGIPPTANAVDRGLVDDLNGNDLFWGIENDHPGDGSPLPDAQRKAIAVASHVVAEHFGLSHRNVISHAEWTRRKSDPYWDRDRRCIDRIRSDMEALEMITGPNGEPNWDQVADWAKESWSWAWAQNPKLITADSHPRDGITTQELMVFLDRFNSGR